MTATAFFALFSVVGLALYGLPLYLVGAAAIALLPSNPAPRTLNHPEPSTFHPASTKHPAPNTRHPIAH